MPSEYTVVTCEDNFERFIKGVNERIQQGWQLQGGVSCAITYDSQNDQMYERFAQALSR